MRSLTLLLLTACAPDLQGNDSDTDSGSDDVVEPIVNVDNGDGTTTTTIDATDATVWAYLDLPQKALVEPADPAASAEWDLAFQRFDVALNGGASGTGGVEVTWVDGADFDALATAPTTGWVTDAPDANDDGDPEYAFATWYDYDGDTHTLSPVDRVYVVRATDDLTYKLEIVDYYDDAGTSGYMTFRWGPVASTP